MNAAVADPTTTLVLPRFGEFTYADSEVIEFPWGIPGFSKLHRFVVLQLEEQPDFVWLQSLDDLNIALPTANPWSIFESYDPKVPSYATESLDLREAGDLAVLCVVIVTKDAQEMTMNLLAPILINLRTLQGRQVTLEGSLYSVREAIPRKPARLSAAEGAAAP